MLSGAGVWYNSVFLVFALSYEKEVSAPIKTKSFQVNDKFKANPKCSCKYANKYKTSQ